MQTGKVIDVINGGSIWLLLVQTANLNLVQQLVEPRYMADIVEGEEMDSPDDLVGREIEMAEDGMSIGFP